MILRMYFGAKQICWRKCPHRCVPITTEEVTFPLRLPSVVRGDSRIRKETKKWKTWSKGLILPFRKQTHRVASGFLKNVSHQSFTPCSFGLRLTDSILFHFLGKKSYFIYSLETLIQFVSIREVSYVGTAHCPCRSTACRPVDIVLCVCLYLKDL